MGRRDAGMLEPKDTAAQPAESALRDDEGAIRADFLERVNAAIERGDAAALRALAGELHESDTGDLIEALDPELRPRFVELLGQRVRLHRAHRGRGRGPRGNPRRAAAASRRRGRPRSRFRRCGQDSRRPAEGRAGRDPRAVAAARARRGGAHSAIIRKAPPDAACRPSSSRCRRRGPSATPSTTCAKPPTCRTGSTSSTWSTRRRSCSARWRSTCCCAPSGRCRSPS